MIRHLYDQTVSLDGEWELFWASHEELRKRGECDKKGGVGGGRLCAYDNNRSEQFRAVAFPCGTL